MREKNVRKIEALKLVRILVSRSELLEKLLEEDALAEAEAEILIITDIVKSLKITIRRLERL